MPSWQALTTRQLKSGQCEQASAQTQMPQLSKLKCSIDIENGVAVGVC